MDRAQIEEWIWKQGFCGLDEFEVKHVAHCMEGIRRWYETEDLRYLGDFTEAVVRNDFVRACCKADDVNVRVLRLYAWFMGNCVPERYRELAKKQFGVC